MSHDTHVGRLVIDELPSRNFMVGPPRARAGNGPAKMGAGPQGAEASNTMDTVQIPTPTTLAGPLRDYNPETVEIRIKATVGFDIKGGQSSAKLTFNELTESVQDKNFTIKKNNSPLAKENGYSSSHCMPTGLRILAAHIGTETDLSSHFALTVKDGSKGSPKIINTTQFYKSSGSTKGERTGYPLILAQNPETSSLLEAPRKLSEETMGYWPLRDIHFKQGVEDWTDPLTKAKYVIMPKIGVPARLAHYAVSDRNQIVPDVLNNVAYTSRANKDLLEMPKQMWEEIVEAYKKKLNEVKSNSFDLDTVTFELAALPNSKQYVATKDLVGYVTFEMTAIVAIAGTVEYPDDEDEEEEEEQEPAARSGRKADII